MITDMRALSFYVPFHDCKCKHEKEFYFFFAEKQSEGGSICFDDIIDGLGAFGHWQRVIFVLISIFDVYSAFAMLVTVFTGKSWSVVPRRRPGIFGLTYTNAEV